MNESLLRKNIREIKAYVPGKTISGLIKLASNENPFGPSPKALEAIKKETSNLHIYPDQSSNKLREALSNKFSLPAECFVCGNGSDDIMQVLAASYINQGDEVIISKNTFSVYELVSKIYDGNAVFVDLKEFAVDLGAISSAITSKTKIIFLTNPNNPTGTIFTAGEFDSFMKNIPENIIVVVDEAYAEFVESKDYPDVLKYIKQGRNVIALRTFSKFYGLAGIRIGYGIGPKELLAPLFKVKMPFNVNRLAQAAAVAALDDKKFLEKTFKNNAEGKKYFYSEFDKLEIDYKKTEANFIFVNLKRPAEEFAKSMVEKGVIIRSLQSFGLPQAIRVSIGLPAQNKKFVSLLK
ncbi:MAG: histidinol-phosphate aminotransferase [Candidatus Saganbacteria bacterium]|uniref:Histidinol-phosphate aminotransferase n=1 Tax=Candidatus Saganbacteria bacterium TaxID=2575572 RepID=A0A833L1Z3_UNCSA|nr:MAG: histidinol-phosphate aminotransferase [Candidatus Saganbacteria bacterium]